MARSVLLRDFDLPERSSRTQRRQSTTTTAPSADRCPRCDEHNVRIGKRIVINQIIGRMGRPGHVLQFEGPRTSIQTAAVHGNPNDIYYIHRSTESDFFMVPEFVANCAMQRVRRKPLAFCREMQRQNILRNRNAHMSRLDFSPARRTKF
jgi:hypothetical protein